jgi:pyruvate/2-oxoglutarate dehydrogenase complex dihydrolipoamide dehydrogenase (E3) component
MDANFTIAAPGTDDAEFVDHVGLKRRFSIGRSAAYTLIENGDIRSVCLRRKGCIKGKRLFEVASVREYFAKQSDEVHPALSAKCKKANRRMQESQKAKREKETAGK